MLAHLKISWPRGAVSGDHLVPLGNYMDNTWAPIWNFVDLSTWVFLGSHLDVNWVLLGFYLGVTWVSLGCYLGVTWVSLGCHLSVTWVSLALALALKHNTFPDYHRPSMRPALPTLYPLATRRGWNDHDPNVWRNPSII